MPLAVLLSVTSLLAVKPLPLLPVKSATKPASRNSEFCAAISAATLLEDAADALCDAAVADVLAAPALVCAALALFDASPALLDAVLADPLADWALAPAAVAEPDALLADPLAADALFAAASLSVTSVTEASPRGVAVNSPRRIGRAPRRRPETSGREPTIVHGPWGG